MGNYNNKEFDRSVAFTFYREWKEDADVIEEDYGSEGKAKFYDSVIEYALFEIEPEMKPPIKYFWKTIKEKIDASQMHRAKGFSKEDTELTEKIKQYKADNPNATQREMASALKCSVGKINKVLKDSTSINTPTTTNASTSTTMNVNMNAHGSQKEEKKIGIKELLESMNCEQLSTIKQLYDEHTSYKEIAEMYGLTYFDSTQFIELYDTTYQEQYNSEHAEEIAKQKEIEKQLWLQEREEQEAYRMAMESVNKASKEVRLRQKMFENAYTNPSIENTICDDEPSDCKTLQVLSELSNNQVLPDVDSW